MRRTASLVALAAAAVLLLSACAGGGGEKPGSSPSAKPSASSKAVSLGCDIRPGDATEGVQVSGAEGSVPQVTVPSGLTAKAEQRSILTKGTGAKPPAGALIIVGFGAYDATSGKTISEPFGWGDQEGQLQIQLGDSTKIPGLSHAFGCVPVASRIVYAAPAQVAFGNAENVQQNFSDGSVKAADTVIFVGDVLQQLPTRADGAPQTPQPGFPTVTLAKDGQPTVTIPKGDPPTTTQIEVLKKGTGPTVAAGDTVTVQYQGTEWASGKIFDQSWGTSHGGDFPSTPASFATTGVVKGFSDALVGQTVGSQVVAVIPPADGYGDSPPSGQTTITKTSTLVFVIDILYTAAAPS